MKTIQLEAIIKKLGGVIYSGNPNRSIQNVIRRIETYGWKDHSLYFHHKGNKILTIDSKNKSLVVITSYPQNIRNKGSDLTIVHVPNIKKAYWNFVRYYRALFKIPFISVTGTCGKTTTKEMISWILQHDRKVVKTNKSQNGLAMNLKYLLDVDEHTDATVIEAAVGSVGHMEISCRYFQPQIGVLTSIGIDHLNGFPSFESYIEEKAKIFSCVGDEGKVIVNGDDTYIKGLDLSAFKGGIIWYGKGNGMDFQILKVRYSMNGMAFALYHQGRVYNFFVPGYGEHNVFNAVAAIAVANELGIDIQEAGRRLRTFRHIERHIEVLPGIKGSILIDDTWSTNPTSIQSALEVLANISKGRKKIAVIGEIKWLAQQSKRVHKSVGDMVVSSGIDTIITIGEDATIIAKRAVELGFDPLQVYSFKSGKEAYNKLLTLIDQKSIVLVKTSMKQSFTQFTKRLKRSF